MYAKDGASWFESRFALLTLRRCDAVWSAEGI